MTRSAENGTAAAPGLREQKREATRQALVEATRRLCAQTPFSQVTVEHVCEAAGVSRRTFFNYFSSKEDAFLGRPDEEVPADLADLFVGMMRPKPPRPADELSPTLFDDLVDLVIGMTAQLPQDRAGFERMKAAIDLDPRLLQVMQQASTRSMDSFAALVGRREGLDPDDERVRVVVTLVAVLAHQALMTYFAPDNTRSFRDIFTTHVAVVRAVVPS